MNAPKSNSRHPLEKLFGIDSSAIPPCKAELTQHIRRACFVARMWGAANQTHITTHPTPDDGWELTDDTYVPIWFQGPQLPQILVPDEQVPDEDTSVEVSSSDEEEVSDSDEKPKSH